MAAFISNLLNKSLPFVLPSELQQEVKAAIDIAENIEKLRSTFLTLQAVVEDAERKQVKSEAVKLWLARLKEVSYDADDLFDQWDTVNKITEKKGTGENHLAKKVRTIFNSFFSTDHIVHKVGNIQNQLDEIARDKAQFNLIEIQSSPEPRLETSSFIKKEEVYGREDDKQIILSKLLSEGSGQVSHVPVISIVGTGGFGKTTLSQLVFNDLKVAAKFEKKMWVCVSQPFDMKKVVRDIIVEAGGEVPRTDGWQCLHRSLSEAVEGKLFFLVLDDVWGYKDELWRQLKLSLDGGFPGSRILITTRNETVAQQMSSSYIYRLKGLSDDDCWELFRHRAFHGIKDPAKFEKIGREISNKCKGVPLATRVLSSLMSLKVSEQDWRDVLENSIWDVTEEDGNSDQLRPELLLSYYALPPPWKQCFVYCAMFPEDMRMEKDYVVKLWVAEGFIADDGTNSLEEIGARYFDGLAMRSFFQNFTMDNGSLVGCKMHDLVRDFALFLMHGSEKSKKEPMRYLHSLEPSLKQLQRLRTLIHFSVTSLKESVCLRVLHLTFCSQFPQEMGHLLHLRYLGLNGLNISKLPESVCDLLNLQTLNLNYCHRLRSLPKRIGELSNLRHLQLEGTEKLENFPESMGELGLLRTLSKFIVGAKSDSLKIGGLKSLSHLQGSLEIAGLKKIANVNEVFEAGLKMKQNIRSLKFQFVGSDDMMRDRDRHIKRMEIILKGLEPPEGLKELKISFYPGREFPFWISSLSNLVKLEFFACDECVSLPCLGNLAFLEEVTLNAFSSVERLGMEFYGVNTESNNKDLFPRLKELVIFNMANLIEWEFPFLDNKKIMPCLSVLRILDCPKLNALPYEAHDDAFPALSDLTIGRHLMVGGCSSQLLKGAGKLKLLKKLEVKCFDSLLDEVLSEISKETKLEILMFEDMGRWKEWGLPIGIDVFSNLVELSILSCESLCTLPALGGLKNLESLYLRKLQSVTRVGLEFLGMSNSNDTRTTIFPKLKHLEFLYMQEWEEWEVPFHDKKTEFFPKLTRLVMNDCKKLQALPALGKLNSLEDLMLSGLDGIKHLGTEFLGISSNGDGTQDVRSKTIFPKLRSLYIWDMPNWDTEEEIMEIDHGLPVMPCLEELTLGRCDMLKVIPRYLFSSSMKNLGMFWCPGLSERQPFLPSRLQELELKGNLGEFSTSLPVNNSYHKLTDVKISDSKCEVLPRGFDEFTAIKKLEISECDHLDFLPEHFRPLNNLRELLINECSLLSKSCIKGENWSTTARTPSIWIDGKPVTPSYEDI